MDWWETHRHDAIIHSCYHHSHCMGFAPSRAISSLCTPVYAHSLPIPIPCLHVFPPLCSPASEFRSEFRICSANRHSLPHNPQHGTIPHCPAIDSHLVKLPRLGHSWVFGLSTDVSCLDCAARLSHVGTVHAACGFLTSALCSISLRVSPALIIAVGRQDGSASFVTILGRQNFGSITQVVASEVLEFHQCWKWDCLFSLG